MNESACLLDRQDFPCIALTRIIDDKLLIQIAAFFFFFFPSEKQSISNLQEVVKDNCG